MASLVLSAVGSYFFGAAGQLLGSVVGSMLDTQETQQNEGPRLTDLRNQNSAYGNAIPELYGRVRLAGNVIWSADILETVHHSSSGGGKGGGGGQTTTTYSYSVAFAVSLCANEIDDISRIWANGVLVYDARASASVDSLIASRNFYKGLVVYKGSEDQLPDPTMEAALGVGNVPAYRGQAYVVFSRLELEDYNRMIPSLEFEVCSAGTNDPGLVKVGQSEPAGDAHSYMGMYSDGYLYTGGALSGLFEIFDCSTPQRPFKRGSLSLSGQPYDVFAQWPLAYVTSHAGKLHIVNISDPNNPYLVTTLSLGQLAERITPSSTGVMFVIGHTTATIYAVNVASWTQPFVYPHKVNLLPQNYCLALVALGLSVYVASTSSPFTLYNVAMTLNLEKSTDVLMGSVPMAGLAYKLYIDKHDTQFRYLYAIGYYFEIFDLWESSAYPTRVASILVPGGFAGAIKVVGNTAYIAGSNSILVYDVTDRSNPVLLHQAATNGASYLIDVDVFTEDFIFTAPYQRGRIQTHTYLPKRYTASGGLTLESIVTDMCKKANMGKSTSGVGVPTTKTFTSASAAAPYVTAKDSLSGWEPWKAFNKSNPAVSAAQYAATYQGWMYSNADDTAWIEYDFRAGNGFVTRKYSIQAPNAPVYQEYCFKSWLFQGWDGVEWVTLDSQAHVAVWTQGLTRTYTFANEVPYERYRWWITAGSIPGYIGAAELEIFLADSYAVIDATSLTDFVTGVVVPRVTSTRVVLESLQHAYSFDMVERDGVVVFVKKGNVAALTISSVESVTRTGVD